MNVRPSVREPLTVCADPELETEILVAPDQQYGRPQEPKYLARRWVFVQFERDSFVIGFTRIALRDADVTRLNNHSIIVRNPNLTVKPAELKVMPIVLSAAMWSPCTRGSLPAEHRPIG